MHTDLVANKSKNNFKSIPKWWGDDSYNKIISPRKCNWKRNFSYTIQRSVAIYVWVHNAMRQMHGWERLLNRNALKPTLAFQRLFAWDSFIMELDLSILDCQLQSCACPNISPKMAQVSGTTFFSRIKSTSFKPLPGTWHNNCPGGFFLLPRWPKIQVCPDVLMCKDGLVERWRDRGSANASSSSCQWIQVVVTDAAAGDRMIAARTNHMHAFLKRPSFFVFFFCSPSSLMGSYLWWPSIFGILWVSCCFLCFCLLCCLGFVRFIREDGQDIVLASPLCADDVFNVVCAVWISHVLLLMLMPLCPWRFGALFCDSGGGSVWCSVCQQGRCVRCGCWKVSALWLLKG